MTAAISTFPGQGSECGICGNKVSGSHYHCGRCNDPKTTSMLGHYTTICRKQPGAKFGSSAQHVCCPDGYCELGRPSVPDAAAETEGASK